MSDRLAELERRLASVERRLSVLEGQTPGAPLPDDSEDVPTLGEGFVSNASTLIGRVLLIFGGAYLLRAITDYQVVPTAIGIFLGAIYALFWLYRAFRIGSDEAHHATALFYGGASVLLSLPLLTEATGRFQLLSGAQSVAALSVFCALYLFVAMARDLRILPWLVVLGGIVTGYAILHISKSAIWVSAFLIVLGLGSLWACYLREWKGLQWFGGLGAATGVLALLLLTGSEQWSLDALPVFYLAAALLISYLASFALRTHMQGHDIGFFESVQSLLVLAVAILAASLASREGDLSLMPVGITVLLVAAIAYSLAFTQRTRAASGRNFYYYSTLGLLLLFVGSAQLLSPPVAAAIWSLLALAMAWCSGRFRRVSLSLQCTFLLLAAGIGSGILETGLSALAATIPESWPPLVSWHVLIALTTVVCLFIPVAQRSERWGVLAGLPQLIVLALSVWEVGGLMVTYAAPIVAGAGTSAFDPAVVAVLRTVVLSAASVTLALSSRFKRWPEARWLVYPVLVLVGIKLFVEDFPHGQPVTLFIALAVVGSALILVAKLLGRGSPAT